MLYFTTAVKGQYGHDGLERGKFRGLITLRSDYCETQFSGYWHATEDRCVYTFAFVPDSHDAIREWAPDPDNIEPLEDNDEIYDHLYKISQEFRDWVSPRRLNMV